MIRRVLTTGAAWLALAAALLWSVRTGRALQRTDPEVFLGAAPLVGRNFRDGWDWRFGWGLVGAAMVGAAAVVLVGSEWWWRASTRVAISITSLGALTFAALLAATDGADGLRYGAEHPTEYLSNVAEIPALGPFLRSFVDDIGAYSVHVRGHPPGYVSLLWVLDRAGFDGVWPTVALSLVATAVLPAAVLGSVHLVGGVEWVRRCAPLLVVAPYAIWMVTSADAVFTTVGAAGVTACVAAATRPSRTAAMVWGTTGGLLLATVLFLTYGGVTLLLVPLVVLVTLCRRTPARLVLVVGVASIAAACLTAVVAALGFWWFEGAAATRDQYWAGTAQFRSFTYFGIANLVVAVIATGPSTYAGLLRLWRTRAARPPIMPFVVGGLVALMASHLSRYTKGEVERIWLLFFPWIVLAAATLVTEQRRRPSMFVVGAQAVTAVLLQAALVSKW